MRRTQSWRSDRDFHVQLEGGFVLIAEARAGAFFATSFDGSEAEKASFDEMFLQATAFLGVEPKAWSLKLIGSALAVNTAKERLREQKLTVSKTIVRETAFELRFDCAKRRLQISLEETQASTIPATPRGKLRVLLVDDSVSICKLLQRVIASDQSLEVAGVITDPMQVEEQIRRLNPDVVTLDIHMPSLDGVTLLKRIRSWSQVPVIMISSITKEEGPLVLEALEAGAFDYVQKPKFDALAQVSPIIIQSVKTAAETRNKQARLGKETQVRKAKYRDSQSSDAAEQRLIAIGSSTGGTEALKRLFLGMPDRIPPTLVAQHIPALFSDALARRFDQMFAFKVKEAEDGEEVTANKVLISPGGRQMKLVKAPDGRLKVAILDAMPQYLHNPSVDFLFDSVAREIGAQAIGVILTGMGSDGAKGMLKMKQAGAFTIAQDEKSCVIFGMPREAIAAGGVDRVLPLDEIAQGICNALSGRKRAAG